MFAESASAGPLFAIMSRSQEDPKLFFERFGSAFEAYVFSVFHAMYPASEALASPLLCNPIGRGLKNQPVQIADVCLDYVSDLLLFEAKAVWLKDSAAEEVDHEKYTTELSEKYVRHANGEEGAVAQMARSVRHLVTGRWQCDSVVLESVTHIYPILLAHDVNLNAPLHSQFLADAFRREMGPDCNLRSGFLAIGRFLISPLIVMTINELEIMQRSIEKFSLRDAVSDYSCAHPERLVSFYNYLTTSKYRNKLIASGMLADAAIKAIERARELMESNQHLE
jgi:hypothetical protein